MKLLKKTSFPDMLVSVNALNRKGFHEWLFCPSMLFQSMDKWWGDQGERDKPHEGLDLMFYSDKQGNSYSLDSETKVPAMYDGEVIRILEDFLGKTIIMGHDTLSKKSGLFCTMFGHIEPEGTIIEGKSIQEGDVIASLSAGPHTRSGVKAHLHISMGLLSPSISFRDLDWDLMGDPASMLLLNPLQVPGWQYQLRKCKELL